ncbi:OTU domain-containing protein [Candidatus Protochlamydia amoebophila]|uniref:OTU domain-containing protein n=1 Tax=Candidatus Protochlamydia amoebophila TaxID=362787 RepID=UPI001BC9EACD|nr:OTU domain-containing protein [Candidatus Protochlamydia amoebophila]
MKDIIDSINHSFRQLPSLFFKEKISSWLGRIWTRILSTSQRILAILQRVFKKENTKPKSTSQTFALTSIPLNNPTEKVAEILQRTHLEETAIPKQTLTPPLLVKEDFAKPTDFNTLEDGINRLRNSSWDGTSPSRELIVDTNSPNSGKNRIIELDVSQEISPKTEGPFAHPSTIDVPDNGNCLFSAIAIGIKLTYKEPEILNQLNWDIDPLQLTKDLGNEEALLKEPSAHLRAQAAIYLHENTEEAMLPLLGSMTDHNEIIERKIIDTQGVIAIIKEDIAKLEKSAGGLTQELKEKREHLKILYSSIQELNDQKVGGYDPKEYINKSSKDQFYCGTAHVHALAMIYKIPIEIIFNFNTAGEMRQILNPSESSHPILTLAYVNGNHFQFFH